MTNKGIGFGLGFSDWGLGCGKLCGKVGKEWGFAGGENVEKLGGELGGNEGGF